MQSETLTGQYEQALTLAESGRYAQALERMLEYLKASPSDGKALNDAGTILFCMKRGAEAVAYFEKALTVCQGDELTQVYWNLCEAYVQEGMPAKASTLFGQMRHRGILNADILNRTAEAFLQKNDLGGAVETLLASLSMCPDQDVLEPMLEVIRRHRGQTVIIGDLETAAVQAIRAPLEKRLPVRTLIGARADAIAEAMRDAQTTIFVGAGESLIKGLNVRKSGRVAVVLDESDLYQPAASQANWASADAVLIAASTDAIEDFRERTGLRSITRVQLAVEAYCHTGPEKKAGKRLAAVGPWNLRRNPMFLLQCFQKLHYCDADMRLHLAGEFEDAGLERYMKSTAEAMNLDTVIFFDGQVKNLNKWLKDKHFIISTAVDESALASVWIGAANGLKPVVHRFAGIESVLDDSCVFTIAEEFCRIVQSGVFEPGVYRAAAQGRYERDGAGLHLHTLICRAERANHATTPQDQAGPLTCAGAAKAQPSTHPEAGESVNALAEQALLAAKALKNIMHQPTASSSAAEFSNAASLRCRAEITANDVLAAEPLPETEPCVIPFAPLR